MPAPPILAVPKGWKPPPGVQKPTRAYVPKPTPVKAPPRAFTQGLASATKQNMRTGGALRAYAQTPEAKQYVKEHAPGPRGKFLGVVPEPWHEPSQATEKAFAKVPRSMGIVVPPLPGLNFLVGADAAAKGVNAAVGKVAGKGLAGKLYNETLQIGMGGPRAAVEAVEHPGKFAKGMAQAITHPEQHPIGDALIFTGLARAGDALAGRAAGISTERAPGVVGGIDQTAVPRTYSKGLVEQAAQKGIEKAKVKAGIDPNLLRTRSLPLYGSKIRKAVIGGGGNATPGVKPGLADMHRGNSNVVADLQAAKGHEFVEANRPAVVLREAGVLSRAQARGDLGRAHDEAVMPLHEGYARRPETYWEDVSKREGRLLMERKGLTDPSALEKNQAQIDQIRLITKHRESIDRVGLNFHEAAARKITDSQGHSFHSELLEGHLHPDQFNARYMGFGLEHGDLLGRGPLHYVKEPGKDPIIAKVGELKKQLSDATRRTQRAKEDLAKATGEAKREKMLAPPGSKAGSLREPPRIAPHYTETLAEARAMEQDARRQVQEGEKEIAHRKNSGFMDPQGNSWHGLYDEHGQRVSGKDLRDLYARETSPKVAPPKDEAAIQEMLSNVKDEQGNHLANTTVRKALLRDKPIYHVNSEIHDANGENIGHVLRAYYPHRDTMSISHMEVDEARQRQGIGSGIARAEERALVQHGIGHTEAVPVSEGGRALTAKAGFVQGEDHAVTKELQAVDGREPGFITHKEESVPVAKGQYVGGGVRPGMTAASRTGEHAMSGNYRNDFGVLHREFRRSARNLSAYRSEAQLIEQFGVQAHVLDGIQTSEVVNGKEVPVPPEVQKAQMVELARELNASPARRDQLTKRELGQWEVVSRGPDRVLSSPNLHDSRYSMQNQIGRAEGKATLEGPGLKYTLIRKGVLERLQSHLAAEQPTSNIVKAMKRMTGYQRHVALYSSPRWPVGVTQENMIRMAAQNTSPLVAISQKLAETSRAYKVGKGYLEGMNKAAGDDLRKIEEDPGRNVVEKNQARTNAGMLEHGSMIGSEVRSMMNDGRSVNQDLIDQLPEFPDRVAGTLGVKQGLAGWNAWKGFLGDHLTNMENRTRTALAGHQLIKEYGTFSTEVKGLLAKEDTVVKQVVDNKLDPVAATKFTEALLDAAGNWSHLTPFTREMRTWMAPFGLWWLNSAKFMFKTMPLEHPLKTALWAALVSATKPDERSEFKQGSIHVPLPFVGGLDISPIHYSTADIFHEDEKTAGSMVLPWFMEAFERSAGVNPQYQQSIYGSEESEGHGPANVKGAAEGLAESFVPFGNLGTNLIRGGGTENAKGSFPTLEAKPGTQKGLLKTVVKSASPVPFTYSTKREKEAEGSGRGKAVRGRAQRGKAQRGRAERGRAPQR
jgi:hypothetical protein